MQTETPLKPELLVLRPKRWRLWASVVLATPTAVAVIGFLGIRAAESPLTWLTVMLILPSVLLVTYTGARHRSLRVMPGSFLEYRDTFFRRRRIEAGPSTQILYFAAVSGSGPVPFRKVRTPIGVIDERWAVLRNDGSTVYRLSMWRWTSEDLITIARALPAELRIHSESVTPHTVARRHPDYYTWLERHPVPYQFIVILLLMSLGLAFLVAAGLFAWAAGLG